MSILSLPIFSLKCQYYKSLCSFCIGLCTEEGELELLLTCTGLPNIFITFAFYANNQKPGFNLTSRWKWTFKTFSSKRKFNLAFLFKYSDNLNTPVFFFNQKWKKYSSKNRLFRERHTHQNNPTDDNSSTIFIYCLFNFWS